MRKGFLESIINGARGFIIKPYKEDYLADTLKKL
ncbi:hypothetical protein B0H37_000721 [Clostridium beijerinckii]|nr:hypothetical protein [Clostridium beijerinckii]NOV68753.1 hypothetical protein [Clostridium beijerinckii]NOW35134.1 hypothetical protein [Clostridium beijerinckii]